MPEITILIPAIIVVVILFIISYTKAPPDTAFIISGIRRQPRILIGRAGFRIPFLERLDKIPLELIQIDIKTPISVPTAEYIDVYIDGVANIKISKEREFIQKAAQHFLNMKPDNIATVAKENLEGNLREIVGQMKLEELIKQRDVFTEKVILNASKDMENMGFEIVNFTIQNIRDDHGAIRDLGVDNLAQIQKHAQIAKAKAHKEVKVEQAAADEAGNKARAEADATIAEQNRDLAIRQAKAKEQEDIAKAKAEAAFSIEEELQRKTINENQVLAAIAKEQKTIDLTTNEVKTQEQRLNAQIRQQADADKYRMEREAEVRLIQQQKEADAIRALADAKRYEMEQEAQGILSIGEAEADVIKAKALAEAEGIDKKAEAMLKYGEAAIIEMYMNALPQVAEKLATPLSNVDSITMYGSDNTTKLVAEGNKNLTQIMDLAKNQLGLDIPEIIAKFSKKSDAKKADAVLDIPEIIAKFTKKDEDKAAEDDAPATADDTADESEGEYEDTENE